MTPGGASRPPSLRMRALVLALRLIAKPLLARLAEPSQAYASFERAARWGLRRPPILLHLTGHGAPPLHWISSGPCRTRGVILYLHGGAYIAGSPETHAGLAGRLSRLTGLRVALPAYRLAPAHPAPAAFDDAMAAYAALRARGHAAGEIVLAGDSAGGGLALALLAALCARGERPACLVALSPWTDLNLRGLSLRENAAADPLLPVTRIDEVVSHVAGDLPADDPRLSPLNAAFDRPPPALILVGDTEILRDDSVRMAERLRVAGGEPTLQIWPRAPHAWPLFDGWIPEARRALEVAAGFVCAHLPSAVPPTPPDRS
jgi:acetyl esterase/lipase